MTKPKEKSSQGNLMLPISGGKEVKRSTGSIEIEDSAGIAHSDPKSAELSTEEKIDILIDQLSKSGFFRKK